MNNVELMGIAGQVNRMINEMPVPAWSTEHDKVNFAAYLMEELQRAYRDGMLAAAAIAENHAHTNEFGQYCRSHDCVCDYRIAQDIRELVK